MLEKINFGKNIDFMKIVFKSISRECFNSDLQQMILKGSDEIPNYLDHFMQSPCANCAWNLFLMGGVTCIQ